MVTPARWLRALRALGGQAALSGPLRDRVTLDIPEPYREFVADRLGTLDRPSIVAALEAERVASAAPLPFGCTSCPRRFFNESADATGRCWFCRRADEQPANQHQADAT